MSHYQPIYDVLMRIGYALVAGVLIALVPWAWQRGRYTVVRRGRFGWRVTAGVLLVVFGVYVWFLWDEIVPHSPEVPEVPETPEVMLPPSVG